VIDFIVFSDKWIAGGLATCALLIVSNKISKKQSPTSAPTRLGLALTGILVFASVTLPVFGYWVGGRSHANAIGGLLPWNDAAGYYQCARSLVDGIALDSFCQRRPHYSAYLSSLLTATGRDVQLTILLQVTVLAIGVFLLARTIASRLGIAAAIIAVATIAGYAGQHSITMLTENLGLVLGVTALTLLLSGAETRSISALSSGALFLTLGLSARSGAFFTLPLLLLWPLFLTGTNHREKLRLTGALFIAILIGFIIGPLLAIWLGGEAGGTHSNFSYTIYGVVSGGNGWLHIFDAHPQLFSGGIPESQLARNIYAESWKLVLERPDLTLQGLTKGFLIYLERILKYIPYLPARAVIVLCWIAGIIHIVRNRNRPSELMLGLLALGIIFSAPIIAFDAGTRIYAATIAIDATIAALGFGTTVKTVSSSISLRVKSPIPTQNQHITAGNDRVVEAFAVLVLLTVIAIPVFIHRTGTIEPVKAPAQQTCARGAKMAVARLEPGAPILPIVTKGNERPWPISASVSEFTTRLDSYTFGRNEFQQANPGSTYLLLYDLSEMNYGSTFFAISENMTVPVDGRNYSICLRPRSNASIGGAQEVGSITPIPEQIRQP
jgi:hypothetical protein